MSIITKRKIKIFIAMVSVVMTFFFIGCKDGIKDSVNTPYNPEKMPMLYTDSVTMLISDSGLIRYKLLTRTWEVYDKISEPYWYFPDKVHLEQLDTTFQVMATIDADTAWNYSKKGLWRLKGNVFIQNSVGETFTSEELFWDSRNEKVYSDKLVVVNQPGKGVLKGTGGFEANQQMTEYTFFRVRDTELLVTEKENKE